MNFDVATQAQLLRIVCKARLYHAFGGSDEELLEAILEDMRNEDGWFTKQKKP